MPLFPLSDLFDQQSFAPVPDVNSRFWDLMLEILHFFRGDILEIPAIVKTLGNNVFELHG